MNFSTFFFVSILVAITSAKVYDVKDASELQKALDNVLPGDFINMADGTYSARFKTSKSGNGTSRITLMGSRNAVITGGNSGRALTITGSYWTLNG